MFQQKVVMGEIVGPHGLHGELRVRVTGDSPEPLLAAPALWLGRSAADPEARRRRVLAGGTGRGGEVRLRLEGIETRADVQAVVGLLLAGPADLLPALPEGEVYWYELVGCRVESEAGLPLGTVREIWETGAHDVLMIEAEDGLRRLIPTAAEIMKEVDLDAGRILVVDLPGLFEPI